MWVIDEGRIYVHHKYTCTYIYSHTHINIFIAHSPDPPDQEIANSVFCVSSKGLSEVGLSCNTTPVLSEDACTFLGFGSNP